MADHDGARHGLLDVRVLQDPLNDAAAKFTNATGIKLRFYACSLHTARHRSSVREIFPQLGA
jgi:hypothetical protein